MNYVDLIDDINLEITGGVTKLEIPDETIKKVIDKAIRELNRYINETKLVTVPFSSCIDLEGFKCNSITNVYRTKGYGVSSAGTEDKTRAGISSVDPMYAQQWAIFSNGASMYNLNSWLLNYMSYNTLLQIQNTTSTDLTFKHDRNTNKLYINAIDNPSSITIEYVPVFTDPEEIKSDYWQNVLLRMSVAMVKIILGRIRSKYKSSNGLWEIDGTTILEEGNAELTALREQLVTNSQITYTLD